MAQPLFSVTVFTNAKKKPLSKIITLDKNGEIKKTTGAQLVSGGIARKNFSSLKDFVSFMMNLPPHRAVSFGVCKDKEAKFILSEAMLKKYEGSYPVVSRTRENFSWPDGYGVLFLDYDPLPKKEALTSADLVKTLRAAVPALAHATMIVKASASSAIYNGKNQITGIRGKHVFVVCTDAKKIPEVGQLIYDRLWLSGHGYIRLSDNGSMLERSIVDTAVWQPERLVFGRAKCEQGLEQRFPELEVFPAKIECLGAGEQFLDPSDLKPLTNEERIKLDHLKNKARDKEINQANTIREKWITKRAKESLGKSASKEALEACKESIRRAVTEGDVLPSELILRCNDGSKVSVAEIKSNPDKWHKKRFADPFETSYGGNDTRIAIAYLKDCAEPLIYSHAHGGLQYYFRPKEERNTYTPDYVQEMNEKFMVVNEGGKVFVFRPYFDEALRRGVLERIKFEDFMKMYMNDYLPPLNDKEKPLSKSKAWLAHPKRRQYLGGVVFAPCGNMNADQFNLWRGWGVTPTEGSWDLIRNHIFDVICSGNNELFDYLLGWMALAVQQPDKPGEVAIVLRGGRGTGKGTFAHLFGKIFGQHYVYITNAKHLTGNFNAHLRDAVLLFADEAVFAGDKSHESVLKALITDPHILVEGKHRDAVMAKNVTHLIMASNEIWVVPTGHDERRFCVIDVSEDRKQDTDYFAALYKEIESGGTQAMLHDLLNQDLSDFNVRKAPKTAALMHQKLRSLRGPESWLHNCLQMGMINHSPWYRDQPLEIRKADVYSSYADNHRAYGDYRPVDVGQFSKTLQTILSEGLEKPRFTTAEGQRPYGYRFAPLDNARAAFEKYIGGAVPWEEPDYPSEESVESDVFRKI